MINDRRRHIPARPSRQAPAQSDIGIVAVGEEGFVKPANLIQHCPPIQRRSAVREQHILGRVVLPAIGLPRASSMIQAVQINQMPRLVDAPSIAMHQNLAGAHTDSRAGLHRRHQLFKPSRMRLGIVVQRSNVAAARHGDSRIAASGESPVLPQLHDAQPRIRNREQILHRSVSRSVIDDDHLKVCKRLRPHRSQTCFEKIAPIDVDDNDRDRGLHAFSASSITVAPAPASASTTAKGVTAATTAR